MEHHQVLAERLLAAVNDTTTTGHITRALLEVQLNTANATKSPVRKQALLDTCMRLRQLQALQHITGRNEVTLRQLGRPVALQTPQTAATSLLSDMFDHNMATTITAHHPDILHQVQALSELNICTLAQIMDLHTGICMPGSQLRHTGAKPRHLRALNKVTMFLHLLGPGGVDTDRLHDATSGKGHSDLPPQQRKVSAYTAHRFIKETTPTANVFTALASAAPRSGCACDIDLTTKKPQKMLDQALRHGNV